MHHTHRGCASSIDGDDGGNGDGGDGGGSDGRDGMAGVATAATALAAMLAAARAAAARATETVLRRHIRQSRRRADGLVGWRRTERWRPNKKILHRRV